VHFLDVCRKSAESKHEAAVKGAESERDKVTEWVKHHLDEIHSVTQRTVSFLGTVGLAPGFVSSPSNKVVQFLDSIFSKEGQPYTLVACSSRKSDTPPHGDIRDVSGQGV